MWEDFRIHVHPTASWQIDPARWWRVRDVRAYLKRYFRQMRGKIENAAFADHLGNRQCSPATLPATAREMVLEWERKCPSDYHFLAQKYRLLNQALESVRTAKLAPVTDLLPTLIWKS